MTDNARWRRPACCALFVLFHFMPMCWAKVATLPQGIELCARRDQECLLRSTQKAVKIVKNGLPALEIPALDPLKIADEHINQGNGPVQMKVDMENSYISGLSHMEIKSIKEDFIGSKGYRLEMTIHIPNMGYEGDYVIGGKILVLPIQGAGTYTANQSSIDASLTLTCHLIDKHGEEYLEIDNFIFHVTKVDKIKMKLNNLFDGNKALGDTMNQFMNENSALLWRELQPAIERYVGADMKNYITAVLRDVPFKKLHL